MDSNQATKNIIRIDDFTVFDKLAELQKLIKAYLAITHRSILEQQKKIIDIN